MAKIFDTYRSACGRARTTYRPDQSPGKPWLCAWCGSVDIHHATLDDARQWFKKRHNVTLEA